MTLLWIGDSCRWDKIRNDAGYPFTLVMRHLRDEFSLRFGKASFGGSGMRKAVRFRCGCAGMLHPSPNQLYYWTPLPHDLLVPIAILAIRPLRTRESCISKPSGYRIFEMMANHSAVVTLLQRFRVLSTIISLNLWIGLLALTYEIVRGMWIEYIWVRICYQSLERLTVHEP
jgi:hypothetical protein